MSDKIFTIVMVARQIGGEYVFVRSEKAFRDIEKATSYLSNLKTQYMGSDGKPKAVRIKTVTGEADCIPEFGIHELEVE